MIFGVFNSGVTFVVVKMHKTYTGKTCFFVQETP